MMDNSLVVQAIQRAMMGFPPGSMNEPTLMQAFELAMERALLGFPSAPLQAPPRYDILLHKPPPELEEK
jgi:hypothetical protein